MTRIGDRERISLIVICGPTASGKTSLAIDLAESFGAEIISADSRQVYRGMDIGTAKATAEERLRVPHHLIDMVDPDRNFTAADFVGLARKTIVEIDARGHLPMLVGGTGLYIRALTEGLLPAPGADKELRDRLLARESMEGEGTLHRHLKEIDPVLAARLHPRDRIRIIRAIEVFSLTGRRLSELQEAHAFAEHPYRVLSLGLAPHRDDLYYAIDIRVEAMMAAGLLDEVRALLARGYSSHLKAMRTIGYRECLQHLEGELSLDETVAHIQQASRRYAKRQLTWFRKDKSIIWVDSLRESDKIQALIDNFIVQH
jgi:tRNA dimethylallyltransferase